MTRLPKRTPVEPLGEEPAAALGDLRFATVEDRDAAIQAEAAHFTATLRIGRRNWTNEAPTLAEAAGFARRLEVAAAGLGYPEKRALVYAVNAAGRTALVLRPAWLAAE